MKHATKPGFIYVLTHPSIPGEYKIGVTTQKVEKRLAQHNTKYSEIAGQIVKETGQKWELKEYHPVEDIYHAENEFWSATGIADIPYRGGVEIFPMDWLTVEAGLNAAKNAGVRPPPKSPGKLVHNREWMIKELEGTGITLIGQKFNHIQYTEFRCAKGHVFRAIPRILANNKTCPICDSE
ncbi:MAG: GIY-YIG nuclease family protein [Candidatus Thiodiazotropha taylori]|nr:GIY-YIG nuclease family protein [Candidatus Thiodiazotropha taylori]MCW4225550.1 GIY-YIG nuclease family protein [Candidatus Thiodiazotropha endolucinida]MCG8034604.1 GIY-YIG nuclease family protein [Candidatus Thiodiazotropha taylori]MCG8058399.1 GIY-YIG nuclease family protein [Candidatus Thiodiazotropha taylori]MCG8078842.1 GIY-YIG nuclease family protein [Candidatus Thiodiazotropha taylori]